MPRTEVSAQEFTALFDELSNWGRWGSDDQRGALNLLTPERIVAATRLVHDGRTVTLSLPLNTDEGIHNPMPADHHMTLVGENAPANEPMHFNKDYVGADYHNDGHTHIDALCHVAYNGSIYNNWPEGTVTNDGATVNS